MSQRGYGQVAVLWAVAGVVASVALLIVAAAAAWHLLHGPSTVTIMPPCFVRSQGFHLPPGGRWC